MRLLLRGLKANESTSAMKLKIKRAELARALYRTQGIADKKSTQPVLGHALLDAAEDGTITVSATDLDVGLIGQYEGEVEKAGSLAIPARQLYEIIKSLKTESVVLEEQENSWIEITAEKSTFRLVGMPADEFPSLPSYEDIPTSTVPAADLIQMIDRTLFCVSTDDKRHNLSGVYCVRENDNQLRLVATDGHRLAMAHKELDHNVGLSQGVIVPRKGFQELKRVLGDMNDVNTVELGFTGNSGVLKTGSVVLSTRLVEGAFPEYQQVIPQSAPFTAKISRPALMDSLRRVSLLSQSRAYGVRLSFGDNQLELVAEDPEFGRATEVIDIDYPHDTLTIGFNARYILDVLGHIRDDGINFSLSDGLSPGVITPLEEQGFLAVVMPMRI